MARRNYALEMWSTGCFAVSLGVIESGVISVYAKQWFAGVVAAWVLNLAVAVLGTMDAVANVLSFAWSSMSHGKPKLAFINGLQLGVLFGVAMVAALPRSAAGLAMMVGVVLAARTCWSGIVTLRPGVWRSNYPRELRAAIIGRVATVQVLCIAAVGAGLGLVLDSRPGWFRWGPPALAAVALAAVWATSRQRVRREAAVLRAEREGEGVLPPWRGPQVMWRTLRADRWYAQYMLWLFVLGFGNLMLPSLLAITLRDLFQFRYTASIVVVSSIPSLVQALAIPVWARVLDRAHVVRFRSYHGWVFVLAGAVLVAACVLREAWMMYAGAVVLGAAYAGGTLAWNLGHHDFSPPGMTSRYMATHVTLNGVRGVLAPLAAVAVYQGAQAMGWPASVCGFGVSGAITLTGAAGFVALRRAMGAEASRVGVRR